MTWFVGPTHDGGYYLVGAKAVHPTLFESDGMGKECAGQIAGAHEDLELSTGLTEPFYDIDIAKRLDSAGTGIAARSREGSKDSRLVRRMAARSRGAWLGSGGL